MPDLAYTIDFVADRFDHTTELPQEYNAGNRFYGHDVAEFLTSQLRSRGFSADYFDEDFGWMVSAKSAEKKFVEICIYYWSWLDPREAPDGLWRLRLSVTENRHWLGLFPRRVEIPAEESLLRHFRDIFIRNGIEVRRFERGFDWQRSWQD